jgi:hypothetical protein
MERLHLTHQWCVLHPATADTGVAVWGDAGLPGDGSPPRRTSIVRWQAGWYVPVLDLIRDDAIDEHDPRQAGPRPRGWRPCADDITAPRRHDAGVTGETTTRVSVDSG